MASAQGVISNLESALKCGGCDCCAGLQSQINALQNQMLTKNDRQGIIDSSVSVAVPLAAGLVM